MATPWHIKEKEGIKTWKRTFKAIGTIGTMTILLYGAYLLDTTQAETITEI